MARLLPLLCQSSLNSSSVLDSVKNPTSNVDAPYLHRMGYLELRAAPTTEQSRKGFLRPGIIC